MSFTNIKTVSLAEITITGPLRAKGSNMIAYNVDLNGRPFGQIWTFKAKGERHPYHVKTLAGFYTTTATRAAAESAIRGQM